MEKTLNHILNKQTILVVDDSPADLLALDTILQKAGLAVSIAVSGEDALAVLANTIIDVAVLDIEMPEMSGLTLYRKILEHREWRTIPVVFVTSDNNSTTVKEAISLGASGFIVKPYKSSQLIQRVFNTLNSAEVDQGLLYLIKMLHVVRNAAALKESSAFDRCEEIPIALVTNNPIILNLHRIQKSLLREDYDYALSLTDITIQACEELLPPSFRPLRLPTAKP